MPLVGLKLADSPVEPPQLEMERVVSPHDPLIGETVTMIEVELPC